MNQNKRKREQLPDIPRKRRWIVLNVVDPDSVPPAALSPPPPMPIQEADLPQDDSPCGCSLCVRARAQQ
ncbi:hypothetical protein EDB85DRAFT_2157972 [Lactarius pseudohatsudake]|nr:hypothetical protein EDB85DRAFT_2157972 [Lactarius pseudohatsudake]